MKAHGKDMVHGWRLALPCFTLEDTKRSLEFWLLGLRWILPFADSARYENNAGSFLSYKGFHILGNLAHLGFLKLSTDGILKTMTL